MLVMVFFILGLFPLDLDLDAYVERHLFDNLPPPHSPTRNWTTVNRYTDTP